MACTACGETATESGVCLVCGHPLLGPDASPRLKLAAERLASGQPAAAITELQRILREQPGAFPALLKLSEAYLRQAAQGVPALRQAARREFDKAVAAAPPEEAAHTAMIELAVKVGGLETLRQAYRAGFKDLPFAAQQLKMISAVEGAPGPGDEPSAGRAGGLGRWLLIAGAAAGLGWLGYQGLGRMAGGVSSLMPVAAEPGGTPPPTYTGPAWAPGMNLVTNGDAAAGLEGWKANGPITFADGTFRLEGDDVAGAGLSQMVALPRPRPPIALLVARTRASAAPADNMSGMPYLWGTIRNGGGGVLIWLSGNAMRHEKEPGVWGVCWGAFPLAPAAAGIEISLQQALRAGGTRLGNAAEFDDVALYFCHSRIAARELAESYTGAPPAKAWLDGDAVAATALTEEPPAQPIETSHESPPGKEFADARAMFDRIWIGMSIHRAAEIMEFDSRTRSWGKDFGMYDKPETVTLSVSFSEDRIFYAAITRNYESSETRSHGRVLVEKGAKPG